jgi:hypothetical protein
MVVMDLGRPIALGDVDQIRAARASSGRMANVTKSPSKAALLVGVSKVCPDDRSASDISAGKPGASGCGSL